MRGNRNAYRGSNVEILFKNSVGDHLENTGIGITFKGINRWRVKLCL